VRNNIRRICLLTTVLVALGGCSDSSVKNDAATDETDHAAEEQASTTAPAITDVANPPATGEYVGALVDVTDQTCDQVGDGWQVTGVATNPTSAAVDYRIYISLLDGAAATRALVETEALAVAPGASGDFDTLIPMPDNNLRCVLRVERRAAGA